MADEEKKVEEVAEAAKAEVTEAAKDAEKGAEKAAAPKKKKKWPIVLLIIVLVIAALGCGFWVWHQQPTFCNAICHTPMDNYVNGYYDDNSGTLASLHRNAGSLTEVSATPKNIACLDCHEAKLNEQMSEGIAWISGNYSVDASGNLTLSAAEVMKGGGTTAKEFCTRCHDYDKVVASTENWGGEDGVNPHSSHQGELECTNCHSAHGTSTLYCNSCHNWKLPDGWTKPTK
mgnify:CR=1 FL=1